MSIYSDLLNMTLAGESRQMTVAEMISSALSMRAGLQVSGDASSRLARNLDYDAVLVRLCEATGVEHHLTSGLPENIVRQEAERRLAERLPSLRPIFFTNQKGPDK